MSYTELRANIVDKMKNGGDGIKNCELVNIAYDLIKIRLPRSPGAPVDAFEDETSLEIDIATRHAQFCKNPLNHPAIVA